MSLQKPWFVVVFPVMQLSVASPWKNVYAIFGECDTEIGHYSSKFYIDLSAAGEEAYKGQITHRFCRKTGEGTGDWHARSYAEIQAQLKPDEIKSSLVLGLTDRWSDALTNLLQTGVAVLLRAYTPGVNISKYGLDRTAVRYWEVQVDDGSQSNAAELVGRELCRQKGPTALKLAALYTPTWIGKYNHHIDGGLKGYFEACPNAASKLVWSLKVDETSSQQQAELDSSQKVDKWKRQRLRILLLAFSTPDVIFAGLDSGCRQIRTWMTDTLTPDEAARVGCVGWYGDHPELRTEGTILASTILPIFESGSGYWRVARQMTDMMQEFHWSTTAEIQSGLDLNAVALAIETVSHDSVGQLWATQFSSYDPRAAPRLLNEVKIALESVSILSFEPFNGILDVTLWVVLSWFDQRLVWNPLLHEGTMSVDPLRVWTPTVSFLDVENIVVGLTERKVIMNSTGHVELARQQRVTLYFDNTKGIKDYPFDSYTCSISLAADAKEIILTGSPDLGTLDTDPMFETTHGMSNHSVARHSIVDYILYKKRYSFVELVLWILPCILLNSIGFIAFWIPSSGESIALGITTLLCTLALRESVGLPKEAAFSWGGMFLVLNCTYQCVVVGFVFLEYVSDDMLALTQCCLARILRRERSRANNAVETTLSPIDIAVPSERLPAAADVVGIPAAEADVTEAVAPAADADASKATAAFSKEKFGSIDYDRIGRWVVVPSYYLFAAYMLWQGPDLL